MRISDWSSDVCSSDLRSGSARADCAPAPRPADSEPNLPPCLSHPDQKDCFADKKRLDKCDRSYKRRSRLMDGMGRMGRGTIEKNGRAASRERVCKYG